MKIKVIIILSVISIILAILLIPDKLYYKDGGTIKYEAILWSVTDRYTMWTVDGVDGHIEGYEIRILWFEVYDNTKFVPNEVNITQENNE